MKFEQFHREEREREEEFWSRPSAWNLQQKMQKTYANFVTLTT